MELKTEERISTKKKVKLRVNATEGNNTDYQFVISFETFWNKLLRPKELYIRDPHERRNGSSYFRLSVCWKHSHFRNKSSWWHYLVLKCLPERVLSILALKSELLGPKIKKDVNENIRNLRNCFSVENILLSAIGRAGGTIWYQNIRNLYGTYSTF